MTVTVTKRSKQRAALTIYLDNNGAYTRHNIEPEFAPLIAAAMFASDTITKRLMSASELRMRDAGERNLTERQKAAWENLILEFGDSAKQLEWPSVREICDAGVDALVAESKSLLENPAVKQAYDHFLLLCELTKESEAK